jgi:hypothetical protein
MISFDGGVESIDIHSSSSEILFSACSRLLEWTSTVFCVSASFFFLRFFHVMGHFLINIVYFQLQFIYLSIYGILCFTLVFAPMSSFICFCVCSYFFYFWCIEIS